MPDTFVDLPDGTSVQIPENVSPEKMRQFKAKLASRFRPDKSTPAKPPSDARQKPVGKRFELSDIPASHKSWASKAWEGIKDTVSGLPKEIAPTPEDLLMLTAPLGEAVGLAEKGVVAGARRLMPKAVERVGEKAVGKAVGTGATAALTGLSAKQTYESYKAGDKSGMLIGGIGTLAGGLGTALQARNLLEPKPKLSEEFTIKEKPSAIEEGEKPKGDLGKHTGDGEVGAPAKAGSGRSPAQRTSKPKAEGKAQETLVAAAYKHKGKVETGSTHPEILNRLGVKVPDRDNRNTPKFGFTTSTGRFVSREEAAKIAEASGQKLDKFDVAPSGKVQAHSDQVELTGKTTGISHRVNVQREASGEIGAVPRGKGTSPEAIVQAGEASYRGEAHAERVMKKVEARLKSTGVGASGSELGLFRAHERQLALKTDQAQAELARNPLKPGAAHAVADAIKKNTEWLNRVKPSLTAASEQMRAAQGEVDVASGQFSSVATRYSQHLPKDSTMTPQEIRTAQEHSKAITELNSKIEAQQAQIDQLLKQRKTPSTKTTGTFTLPKGDVEAGAAHFARRKADGSLYSGKPMPKEAGAISLRKAKPNFTQQEIDYIWDLAKTKYIGRANTEKGKTFTFDEAIAGLSRDLGLTHDEITHAFTSGKTIPKSLINQQWMLLSQRRRAIQQAKVWTEAGRVPGYQKFASAMWNIPRGMLTLGHGPALMITHGSQNLFDPQTTRLWIDTWADSWRTTLAKNGEVAHEQLLRTIEADPKYAFKVRSGLHVGSDVVYDDMQNYLRGFEKTMEKAAEPGSKSQFKTFAKVARPATNTLLSIIRRGDAGMDALKLGRSRHFDVVWDSLPDELKTETMAKDIATDINNAWGSGDRKLFGKLGKGMFAPSLEESRLQRVLGDPVQVAKGLASGEPEKVARASMKTKRAARVLGTFMGTLAVNEGINRARGSDDKVNFTDPTKPDWLAYKFNGHTFDPTGGVKSTVRFLVGTILATQKSGVTEGFKQVGQYAGGKAHPAIEVTGEAVARRDFTGRPLPFASQEMKDKAEKKGKPPLTWGEYMGEKFAPLPIGGIVRDTYEELRQAGVNDNQAKVVSMALVAAAELSGVRVGRNPQPKAKKKSKDPLANIDKELNKRMSDIDKQMKQSTGGR